MGIREELIDELLAGRAPGTVMRQDGLLGELKQALLNRLMAAEFDHHLGHESAQPLVGPRRNHRNGSTQQRVTTDNGVVSVTIPRDREARFDPVLIGKYQRRLPGFDDKVISLYARGVSTREIQGHLQELYGIEVSPDLISTVTDAVVAEAAEWQARPLDALYTLVFFDALRVKVRDEGMVRNKAVYLALGIATDGRKEVLGLWVEQTEGSKFWLRIVNELRNRGVADILIAVVDGLKGFPAALKPIYQAATPDAAAAFEAGPWGRKYPAIAPAWRRQWEQVTPFFAFPPEVRRIIYTTNAIESLNAKLRSSVCSRDHFPNDEAAIKLLYLVLRDVARRWTMAAREWTAAKTQFTILFGERFSAAV